MVSFIREECLKIGNYRVIGGMRGRYSLLGILIVGILYFTSRVLFLDSDLPAWNVGFYQPMDELYYSVGAFELFHRESSSKDFLLFLRDGKYIANFLMEGVTALSLSLFGNNYYGLRGAPVLAGWGVLLLTCNLVWDYIKGKKDIRPFFFLSLYMVTDFSFLLSNRVAEPTIFRMLSLLLLMKVAIKISETKISFRGSFILGFFSLASVIYIYTSNFFLIPAMFFFVGLITFFDNRKIVITNLASYSVGALFGVGIFLLVYEAFFDVSYIISFLEILPTYEGRSSFLLSKIVDLLGANMFRFSPVMLFFVLLSIPLFIYSVVIRREKFEILLFVTTSMFLLQSCFLNDYYQRKLIFMFPLLLMIIMTVYLNREIVLAKIYSRFGYWVDAFLVASFSLILIWVHKTDGGVISYSTLLFSFLLIVLFLKKMWIKPRLLLLCLALTLFSSNVFQGYRHIYSDPSYKYRDAMKRLEEIVGGHYTIGWSHAMRMYNTSIPLMNMYTYSYWAKSEKEEHKRRLLHTVGVLYEFVFVDPSDLSPDILYSFDIGQGPKEWIGVRRHEAN